MSIFQQIKSLFSDQPDPGQITMHPHLGRAVLLLEAAVYDHHYSDDEKLLIEKIFKDKYGLDTAETDDLLELAEKERARFPDLQSFTRDMVGAMGLEERQELMTEVWRVIFADGMVDPHEEHLARKLQKLLRLNHSHWIAAKIAAQEAQKS